VGNTVVGLASAVRSAKAARSFGAVAGSSVAVHTFIAGLEAAMGCSAMPTAATASPLDRWVPYVARSPSRTYSTASCSFPRFWDPQCDSCLSRQTTA